MQKNCASQSGIFTPRVLVAFALCSFGVLLGMFSVAATPSSELTRINAKSPAIPAKFLSALGDNSNGRAPGVPFPPEAQFSVNTQSASNSATGRFAGFPAKPLLPRTARADSLGNPVFANRQPAPLSIEQPTGFRSMPLASGVPGQWSIASSPNTSSTQYNFLTGVACSADADCWAVGWYYDDNNIVRTLLARDSGSGWTFEQSAPPPENDLQDLFTAITCASPTNCWAVGYYDNNGLTADTFTEHFDGSNWTVVSSPNPISRDSRLYAVSCPSANDCWAVGYYAAPGVFSLTPSYANQTLVEHNTGSGWAIVSSPNITVPPTESNPSGQANNLLLGVSCTSASNCWAVGWYYNAQGVAQTLVQHYNGSAWSIVSSPNIDTNFLAAIDCVSASDCWAVGSYHSGSGPNQTLVEHYDGTAWSIVPTPNNPNGQNNSLYGVTCVNTADCWAVGRQYSDTSDYMTGAGNPLTLIQHYDGTAWSIITTPNTHEEDYDYLFGVACRNASDCWAVGNYYDDIGSHTLAEHYTVPPIPTSVVSRKIHGSVGAFDVDLPLDGSGIECRSGGTNGNHTLVFTFPNALTSVGGTTVSSGTGTVSNSAIGSDPHNYIVDLTGVANAQTITVKLASVADGVHSGDLSVSVRVLSGDTNADGVVNSTDIAETKSQSGNGLTSTNFREDVTAEGSINSTDIALVKSKSGTALP
jgi:hypothetical protein